MDLAAARPSSGAGASNDSTLSRPSSTPNPQVAPTLIEYRFGAETWHCARFEGLRSEFETVTPANLERFHQLAMVKPHTWKIVRRLFSLRPMLPPPETEAGDLREWGWLELCEEMGLTRPQLRQSLDALRGAWLAAERQAQVQPETQPTPDPSKEGNKAKAKGELDLADDPLLKEFGFELAFKDSDEQRWFVGRVRDFEKVLKEKMVGGMARNALMTDLRCRRLNRKIDTTESNLVGGKDWIGNLKLSEDLAASFNTQVKEILDLCPWASAIAGKMALAPVVSIITQALQEAHAKNSTRLVDGIFTATEIQVECRRSTQMPEPRYRAGLVVYLNAAKAGTFDPNWKPPFEPRELAKLDAAWKAAYLASSHGEAVPDLEADGPGSEYPDLVAPEEQIKAESHEN